MDECEEDIYYFGPPKSVREYTCIPKENYQQMQSKLSELEAENVALRAENANLKKIEERAVEQSEYIQKRGLTEFEMARKDAEIERLRAALEATQWARWGETIGIRFCPVCHGLEPVHYSDCIVKAALSPDGA